MVVLGQVKITSVTIAASPLPCEIDSATIGEACYYLTPKGAAVEAQVPVSTEPMTKVLVLVLPIKAH